MQDIKDRVENLLYWHRIKKDKEEFYTAKAYIEAVDIVQELAEQNALLADALKDIAELSDTNGAAEMAKFALEEFSGGK